MILKKYYIFNILLKPILNVHEQFINVASGNNQVHAMGSVCQLIFRLTLVSLYFFLSLVTLNPRTILSKKNIEELDLKHGFIGH